MKADELMTSEVSCIRSTENVAAAVEVLNELELRHLPVVDGGELVGMLSDRDLRELGIYRVTDVADLDRIKALGDTAVSSVMSSDVQSVEPSASLNEVIELMISEKVGAVPVVEEHSGTLVGIISYVDVLRAAGELLS